MGWIGLWGKKSAWEADIIKKKLIDRAPRVAKEVLRVVVLDNTIFLTNKKYVGRNRF